MKKHLFLVLFLSVFCSFSSYAQADFFAGKWDILVKDTPNGDIKFSTNLYRDNGKLTGILTAQNGSEKTEIPLSNVEDSEGEMTLYFSAQGYDISLVLNKVDANNLKGSMMNMFDATAVRMPETTDFFAGKWDILVKDTPNGDIKFATDLKRDNGKLTGMLTAQNGSEKTEIPLSNVEDSEGEMTLFFSAQGYDISLVLNKVDDNNLKGSMMNMFDASAVRGK